MLLPYLPMCVAWCLYASRLFICHAYGVQCPSCLQCLWIHKFPLIPPCRLAVEKHWSWRVTISYKQCFLFGLLSSVELYEAERCVKRITSLFRAASLMKQYYSISPHGRALNKSRNSVVMLGGRSRSLPDAESMPVTSQSSLLRAWSHNALS